MVHAVRDVRLAVFPPVPGGAATEVAVQLVNAFKTGLEARVAVTFVDFFSAVLSGESVRADAVMFRGAWSAGTVDA